MEISPIKLAMLLFYSFLFGIGMGAFYDANRIIRVFCGCRYSENRFEKLYLLKLPFINRPITRKSNRGFRKNVQLAVVFLGDMICVVVSAIGILILNYAYNSGRFRFFTVFGVLIGFLLYYFTVGKLIMLISEPIAILIKYVFLSFLVIFGYPFKTFFCFAVKKLKKYVFLYSFTLENRAKKLYNIEEKKYLVEMSKNGFFDIDMEDV